MSRPSYTTSKDRRYYLDASGAPNLTRLADDALSDLKAIHETGRGRHQLRSRGAIRSRVSHVLISSGYCATENAARRWFDDQIVPAFNLWLASDRSE